MDKLRPCPFCGGEANIAYNAKRRSVDNRTLTGECVYCTICPAQIFMTGKGWATEAWNRRVGEQE